MVIQKDKDNTIVELVLQMLMEEKSLKKPIKLSFMLDYQYLESMPKLLLLNGNIKSELLKELNVEIICGWLNISYKEQEKNMELIVILNQNPLKEIGMDQDVIAISHSKKLEKMVVMIILLIIACLNQVLNIKNIYNFMDLEMNKDLQVFMKPHLWKLLLTMSEIEEQV